MKIPPWLAYIVVQRPFRYDESQKLAKAAGIGGNSMAQAIDVVMFLDRESAEEFRQNDIVFSRHADVVEVVVMDSDSYSEMVDRLAPAWVPASLPPGPLPNNFGRSQDVLVVTDVGRVLVAHAYWPGQTATPVWVNDDLDSIYGVVNWTSLPKLPPERNPT